MIHTILMYSLVLALGPAAAAQHVHPAQAASAPATSSLSAAEVQQLLDGEGMGLAKAAELNGYPGPKHVLERAAQLGLTDAQRAQTMAIHAKMLSEAQRLGRAIVDAERALDEAFRSPSLSPADMTARVQAIGALQAELRAVHLNAHLEGITVLSAEQVRKYYDLGAHGGHGR